jgi:hypothetical protein
MSKLTTKAEVAKQEEKEKPKEKSPIEITTEVVTDPTNNVNNVNNVKPQEESKKPEYIPRKQKRLQERVQAKCEEKEKRVQRKREMSISSTKQSLEKIRQQHKEELIRKSLNLSEADEQRLKRIIFGTQKSP